jgi:hypothetical protein
VQGEYLTALLERRKLPWNIAFEGGAVVVPDNRPPLRHTLQGGMQLTLLSPTTEQLVKLRPKWNAEVRRAGLEPGVAKEALKQLASRRSLQPDALGEARPNVQVLAASRFGPDAAEANGSSIAVLAEYDTKRCLLTGDAFAPVLVDVIQRLLTERQHDHLTLDACKLPHHGSQANLSKELLNLLRCQRYLISTNGKIFHHPDAESIARVIVYGGAKPSLYFNYRTEENAVWDDARLLRQYEYSVTYPKEDSQGLLIRL